MTEATMSNPPVETKSMSIQRIMLSLEGLTVFISSIAAYWYIGGNPWLFALLLLSPDLVFVIYAMNKVAGTHAYNLVHSYSFPVAFGILSLIAGWQLGLTLAIIWFAHIGMDRTVGYGLKYVSDFKDTHLQRV